MNRLRYDECASAFALNMSTAPAAYVLDPVRYSHANTCRPALGIVGGSAVSLRTENLVDLENDLRGQTRPLTACPNYKYMPRADGQLVSTEYIKPVHHPVLRADTVTHLPVCAPEFVRYTHLPCEKK